MTARIGLAGLISLDDLEAVYVGCVFGQAWNPDRTSPWCNVFEDEDLSVLEYRDDGRKGRPTVLGKVPATFSHLYLRQS